jgi:hypothetical protein
MPSATSAEITEPAPAGDQPGLPLRLLLKQAGLSPEKFARRLSRLAADQGVAGPLDAKTPYKWLRGSVPRHPWPELAACELTARLGTRVTAADLGWASDRVAGQPFLPAGAGLEDLPWTVPGALTALGLATGHAGLDGLFLPASGTALATPALDWLTAGPAGDPARAEGQSAGIELAGDLEHITARLRRMDARHGGGLVLPLAQDCARYLTGILRGCSYPAAAGLRLYAAAAELHGLAGWLSWDAGRPALAHRHWLAGLRAAHAAADPAAGAGILAGMSAQASAAGQPGPALHLARAAHRGHPHPAPRLAALVSFAAAHAHAAAGDAAACRAAIAAARQALAAASPDTPGTGPAAWLDPAAASALAGTAYLSLKDYERARRSLNAALQGLDPAARARDTALAHALLALAHAGLAKPEAACQSAAQALTILTQAAGSGRCASYLRQLCEALRPYHRSHPAVTALTAQVQALPWPAPAPHLRQR